jgi:sRNA-binding protein
MTQARTKAAPLHAVLLQLASLYPALFGDKPLPLKRGIFQDLLAAQPEALEKETLKEALSQHTRASRYLNAVASGLARHDLSGAVVEAMAPEHVYQALVEVFRRKQIRAPKDVTPEVRTRMAEAFLASGMSREDYAEKMRGKNEAINAVLDEALAQAAVQIARDEAQLRAFEQSGQTVAAFADMYGLDVDAAQQTLDRAKARHALQAPAT